MKWSGRRAEKSLSGKAVFRVDTRRKCTLLRFESVRASEALGVEHDRCDGEQPSRTESLVTYRDSLTSSLPKHDERPASFISGEKDILEARVSFRPSGDWGRERTRESSPPSKASLFHLLLAGDVGFLHLLEHLALLGNRLDRVGFDPHIDPCLWRGVVGKYL